MTLMDESYSKIFDRISRFTVTGAGTVLKRELDILSCVRARKQRLTVACISSF